MRLRLRVTVGGGHRARNRLDKVETLLRRRTHHLLQRHKLRHRCHLTRRDLDVYIVKRRRIQTILGSRTHQNLIDLSELIEITHVYTSAVGSQRSKHLLGCSAGTVALNRINRHLVFGIALRIGGDSRSDLRPLTQFGEESVGLAAEIGHIAVAHILHLQINRVGRSVTRYLRHLERDNIGVLDRLAIEPETPHYIINIVLESRTFLPVLETHNQRRKTGAVGRDHSVAVAD